MSDYVSNLYIKSFRRIRELELQELKYVNILTGDNNSGKTSVLEVIESLALPYSFKNWRFLLREEVRHPIVFNALFYEAFLYLFDIENDLKRLEYGAQFEDNSVHIKMTGYENEEEMSAENYEKNIQMLSRVNDKEEL